MTQDNGFREKVKEVLHDVWIDKLTQDEATDRIVQLVRELADLRQVAQGLRDELEAKRHEVYCCCGNPHLSESTTIKLLQEQITKLEAEKCVNAIDSAIQLIKQQGEVIDNLQAKTTNLEQALEVSLKSDKANEILLMENRSLRAKLSVARDGLDKIIHTFCCQESGCTYPTIDTAKHIAKQALAQIEGTNNG